MADFFAWLVNLFSTFWTFLGTLIVLDGISLLALFVAFFIIEIVLVNTLMRAKR